jgi:hypothetical protein
MSKNQIGGKLGIADVDLKGKRVLMRYVDLEDLFCSPNLFSCFFHPLIMSLVSEVLIIYSNHCFILHLPYSVDFNVPQDKNGVITNTQRIVETLPTIKHALEHGMSLFSILQ